MNATLRWTTRLVCIVGSLVFAISSSAQDEPPEQGNAPAPSATEGRYREVIAANVVFGKDEATGFWPLYGDYRRDVEKLDERRGRAVAAYAESFRSMTGDAAKTMLEDLLQPDEERVKLKRDYTKKLRKVLPDTKITRVFMIDARLDAAVSSALFAKIPLEGEQHAAP